jgi:hypothetical protein
MSKQAALAAVLLLSSIPMTQQPVNAAQPWPSNIDPTTDTRSFLLWENAHRVHSAIRMMTSQRMGSRPDFLVLAYPTGPAPMEFGTHRRRSVPWYPSIGRIAGG